MTKLRVVIADDQPLIREGLGRVIETDPDLEVVGTAVDGADVVKLALEIAPDVILMDIRMPFINGIDATRALVSRGFAGRVIILTTFGLDEYVIDALRAGASGFILKESAPELILQAIHVVAAGDALIDPAVTHAVITQLTSRPSNGRVATHADPLTQREDEVLKLLARGLSNAEIASHLVIGEGTVKTHVAHILTKLNVRDRLQAVIYAYENGLA